MFLKHYLVSRNIQFRRIFQNAIYVTVLLLLLTVAIFEIFTVKGIAPDDRLPDGVQYERNKGHDFDANSEWATSKKIVIGAVSCRNKSGDLLSPKGEVINYSEKTLVMFKSVIISAKLFNISTVTIHLFLEHPEDEQLFVRGLAELGYPSEHGPELILHTHSAVDPVPEGYRDHMVYHPRYRCGFVRFFFPSALPEVDSILHLDSDMIITGNVWSLWTHLDQFQGEQMIAGARDFEANHSNYLRGFQHWFGDIPHPPPAGINGGLLLMNLTRMRDYGWEKRFLRIYDDYSKIVNLTGQRTVNTLLGVDPGISKVISCQYNFNKMNCEKGFNCDEALEDNLGGIHLAHGQGFQFDERGSLQEIYKGYQRFNMSILKEYASDYNGLVAAVRNQLMLPIRRAYGTVKRPRCLCYGTLNNVLFKDVFQ